MLPLENPSRAVSLARKELARGAPSLMLLCRSVARLCKKIKKGKKEREGIRNGADAEKPHTNLSRGYN